MMPYKEIVEDDGNISLIYRNESFGINICFDPRTKYGREFAERQFWKEYDRLSANEDIIRKTNLDYKKQWQNIT